MALRPPKAMMNNLLRMTGSIMALAILMGSGVAEALDTDLRAKFAGAASATEVDLNADGRPTSFTFVAQGFSTLGPISVHSLVEGVAVLPTGNCNPGEIENTIVARTTVFTDTRLNQLLFRHVDGIFCSDRTFTTFRIVSNEEIIGGTGRFEGATGEAATECTGTILSLEIAKGRAAHIAATCKVTGTIQDGE